MFLALMIAAGPMATRADVARRPDVLLLHSYHSEFPWTDGVTKGLRAALNDDIDPEGLRLEYMDARRHMDDPKFSQLTLDYLHKKYADEDLGLVVISDEPAFDFWLDHGQHIAPAIPVVFGGVNVLNPEALQDHPEMTGVVEGMEIEKNIELIARLQPKLGRLIVLGDETKLGQKMVQRIQERREDYEALAGNTNIEVWDRFESFEHLYDKAANLQSNDAILVLAVHRDGQGHYWSYAKNLEELTRHSKAPVYAMWGITLGHGVVGGYVNDPIRHGHELGALGIKLLRGTPAQELPIVNKTTYLPTFDKKVLARFGLDPKRLPKGSTFVNQPPAKTFAQRQPLWLGLSLLAGLFALHRTRRLTNRTKQQERRVIKLHRENRKLSRDTELYRNLAMTDDLTGTANRRAGTMRLDALCTFAKQEHRIAGHVPALAVAIADIDHFKSINDTFGHDVGDEVLAEVTKCLQSHIRPQDDLCRWGGEEFLIILGGMNAKSLFETLDRVRNALQSAQVGRNIGVKSLTASFGAAMIDNEFNWRYALERADKELYRAKSQGRNQVCISQPKVVQAQSDQNPKLDRSAVPQAV